MEKTLDYEALPQRGPRRRKKKNKNVENVENGDDEDEENEKKRAKTNDKPTKKNVVVMMMNTTNEGEYDGDTNDEDKRTKTGANATTTTACFLSTEPIVSYDTTAATKNQYEYKDHTADIQIKSWGDSITTAFAWSALGMFDYMTPLHNISETPKVYRKFECSAHDLKSLLFAFLDELLFVFHTESLVCTKIQINEFRENKGNLGEEVNRWTIEGIVAGDLFVDGVHEQGTEVKAITYSEMQIHVAEDGSTEVYVIVDI
jgi:SHS2 domain-containing protein